MYILFIAYRCQYTTIPHTNLHITNATKGSMYIYQCDPGYIDRTIPTSSETIMCDPETLAWTGVKLQCEGINKFQINNKT